MLFSPLNSLKLFSRNQSLKNANLALIDQSAVTACNFLTTLVLARNLPIESFGLFTLLWSILLLLNTFNLSFINAPLLTLGPAEPKITKADFYSANFCFQQLLSFSLILLTSLCLCIFKSNFEYLSKDLNIFSFAIAVYSLQLYEYMRSYFFSIAKPIYPLISDIVTILIRFSFIFCLILLDSLNVTNIFLAIALAGFASAFLALKKIRIRLTIKNSRLKYYILQNFAFSKWLSVSSSLQWLGGNFFVFASGSLLSLSAVGAISALRTTIGPTLIFFAVFENIVTPKASINYTRNGMQSLLGYVKKSLFIGLLPTIVICIIAVLFSDKLIVVLFGEQYVQYSYLMPWFAVSHLMILLIKSITIILKTISQTRQIAQAILLSTVFSLCFSIPFIKNYGLLGTMIIMTGNQLISFLYLLFFNRKLLIK